MRPSPITIAAISRIRKQKRSAKRALTHAIANGLRLTPELVKLAVAEVDALSGITGKLTEHSNHWNENTSSREIDALMKRADDLTAQLRARTAHPQVRAALLAREESRS